MLSSCCLNVNKVYIFLQRTGGTYSQACILNSKCTDSALTRSLEMSTDNVKRQSFQECKVPCKVLKIDKTRRDLQTCVEKSAYTSECPDYSENLFVSLAQNNVLKTTIQENHTGFDSCFSQSMKLGGTHKDKENHNQSKHLTDCYSQSNGEDPECSVSYHYIYDSPYHSSLANSSVLSDIATVMSSAVVPVNSAHSGQGFRINKGQCDDGSIVKSGQLVEVGSQLETDLGYLSHSTSSSCQAPDSQREAMFVDQQSQGDSQVKYSDIENRWDDGNDGDVLVDDLVHQFGKNFKTAPDNCFVVEINVFVAFFKLDSLASESGINDCHSVQILKQKLNNTSDL